MSRAAFCLWISLALAGCRPVPSEPMPVTPSSGGTPESARASRIDDLHEGRSIADWLARAKEPDEAVAREAVAVIRRIGLPAIEEVIAELKRPDRLTTSNCLIILTRLEADASPTVPALKTMLGTPDPALRCDLARLVYDLSPEDRAGMIEILMSVLKVRGRIEDFPSWRIDARYCLKRIGIPALPALIRALDDDAVGLRHEVCETLSLFGPSANSALPRLEKLLPAGTANVRIAAAKAYARIAPGKADRAIDVLLEYLNADDDGILSQGYRMQAIVAAQEIGPPARRTASALRRWKNDPDEWVKESVTRALKEIGASEETAWKGVPLSRWIERLDGTDATQWSAAMEAIGGIGPEASAAVPMLAAMLRRRSRAEAMQAASTLVKLGPEGIQRLLEGITDPDADVRLLCSMGLEDAGAQAVPGLIRHLDSANREVPVLVSVTLSRIGAPAIPGLREALRDESRQVRAFALIALSQMKPPPLVAIPDVRALLNDPQANIRELAGAVLKQWGR